MAALVASFLIVSAGDARGTEPHSFYTGKRFVEAPAAEQITYVAGLADSLLGLYRAQLVDGFRWFEVCATEKSPAQMVSAIKAFLSTNDARLEEPLANNFIWAMAAVCRYPVK